MHQIHAKLVTEQRAALSELLEPGMHKSALIGVFLAVLELVRHHSVRTQQNELHGEIWVIPDRGFNPDAEFTAIDSHEAPTFKVDDLPVKPR
jgi:segregation and condensation protein A